MAGQGWWRLPADGLAPGHTGWGLLRKWIIVPVLGLWGEQVPPQLLIGFVRAQMRGSVPATLQLLLLLGPPPSP